MPESWTARGALLLTLLAAAAAGLAVSQAPSMSLLTAGMPLVELVELRASYYSAWYAQTVLLVGVLATLWTAYTARHLVPTPPGWGRPAPTSAELRVAERPATRPTPTELGEV